MRVPIFDEVEIDNYDVATIIRALENSKASKSPCYIDLSGIEQEETIKIINNILFSINKLKIDPYFPYPLYIISEHVEYHPEIPTVEFKSDLPKYYFKKIKKLSSKEQLVLNKINTLTDKIINQSVPLKRKQLISSFAPHKKLFLMTKENEFLEGLIDKFKQGGIDE